LRALEARQGIDDQWFFAAGLRSVLPPDEIPGVESKTRHSHVSASKPGTTSQPEAAGLMPGTEATLMVPKS